MSDNTNINENEAVIDGAASENKAESGAVDAAQLAYLVYAKKYRKKLQADKKKAEKQAQNDEAAPTEKNESVQTVENESAIAPSEAADTEAPAAAPEAENMPEAEEAPVAEEAVESDADMAPEEENENSEEELASEQSEMAAENENSESEPENVEPAGEAMLSESEPAPEDEAIDEDITEQTEASDEESLSVSDVDDSNMIITVDPEAKKKNTLDGIDMDLNIEAPEGPEEEKNTLDGVDMDLDMAELAAPPMPKPAALGAPYFGAPAPVPADKSEDGDGGKLMLNIDEEIKEDENFLNLNARVFPVEAFDSLVKEKNALEKMLDDHYKAYADEMERLRQKHLYLQMDATARAAAEHSEEYKLLQKEEERYKREVDDLSRRREESAKNYLDRKSELESILDEYDARNADLSDAGSAIQRIAADAANVTAAIAGGLAGGNFAAAVPANAQLEHERAMAAALLEKEKAQAEARVEAEKRAAAEARLEAERAAAELKVEKAKAEALAQYSAERAAANAKINELERDAAVKAAIANAKSESLNDAKNDAERIARELENAEKAEKGRHVVVPGAIDKARDDAALRKKLEKSRKRQSKNVTLDTLPAYIAAAQRDLDALEGDYSALEAKNPRNNAERIDNSVERLDVRRRAVEKMTDKLLACKDAGAPTAVCEKHRDELRQAVAQYNSAADDCGALLGKEPIHAETDMAERVLRGEDYQELPVIVSHDGVVTQADGSPIDDIQKPKQAAEPMEDAEQDTAPEKSGEIDGIVSDDSVLDAADDALGAESVADASGIPEEALTSGITSLDGLSKKQAKEMLKAEKDALKEESLALAESSRENAKRAKEAAKLAKHGDKETRKKYKTEAVEYAKQSAAEDELSKKKSKTEKELRNLKDYEKYLALRAAESMADGGAKVDTTDYDIAVSKALKRANETSDYEDYRELYRDDKRDNLRDKKRDMLDVAREEKEKSARERSERLYDEFEQAQAAKRGVSDDAELQKKLSAYRDKRKKNANVDIKNLPAYLAVVGKELSALDKEYRALEVQKPKTQAECVENAVERLGIRRRSVEKATDKLLACRSAGAPTAICERHRDELNEAVSRYNAVVDEYRALTGHSLTRAEADMADRVLRGEEYQLLPIITSRREIVSKEDGSRVAKLLPSDVESAPLKVDTVVDGQHQLTDGVLTNKKAARASASVVMTEKDIPKFLKKQKIKEAKLRERDGALAEIEPETTEDKVVVLVERIGTQRELIASLSTDLKLAVAIGDKRKIRSYKKQLTAHIGKYNRLADRYRRITGDSLTRADENIPEYIESGAQYKSLPVISYRKESPDGKLLSDKRGAGVTMGAAYALIPENKRCALERRGVIEKKRATSITGLSKKEAKARLKNEKAALKAESATLAELSRENAKKSKDYSKYAKRGTKEERARYRAMAIEYANRSASDDARSKELAKIERKLKNLKDYEEYLLDREMTDGIIARAEPGKSAYPDSVAEKLAVPTAQMREYEAYKALSKREKREKLREERESLLAEARAYDETAELDLLRAKEEKKLSKRGTRMERAEHNMQSEMLKKSADDALLSAKNIRKTAKSLKNERDYERYLAGRAERAEILRHESEMAKGALKSHTAKGKATADSAYEASGKYPLYYPEAQSATVSDTYSGEGSLAGLTKREKKARLAEERKSLCDVADALDAESVATGKSAKAAKAQAKLGSRYDRAEARAEAKELTALSLEQKRRADETRKTAKSLRTVGDYEKYVASRELDRKAAEESMRAAERMALSDALSAPEAFESDAYIADPSVDSYEKYLESREMLRDARTSATAFGVGSLAGLTKREKKALLAKEKKELLERAEALEAESVVSADGAKKAKAESKQGSRRDRAEARAEAKELMELSASQKLQAKEARKTAKSLKTVDDYEKYIASKSQSADASTAGADNTLFDRRLSKRELRAQAKQRSVEYEREAKQLERQAREEALLAKEERRLAKHAKRSDRPIHESEADAFESHSRELLSAAEAKRIEALELKELKTLKAFEEYNAKREALAAEKLLASGAAPKKARAEFADADCHIKHNRAAVESFCREQAAADETMLKRRYETRAAMAKSEIEIKKLHFGEKNRKYKKSYAALTRELATVEAHLPKAIRAERRDNERYYAVVKSDINNMKLPKNADRANLTRLQIEIEALLKERDAVNRELTALYNSNKNADVGKNNTYERLKSATKGAKTAYKKQRKLANEIDTLHIPLDEKKKIFDPMNRITQLNAEINDLAYRIEREKLKGRAKNAAISSIKKKKKERAYLERNIKTLSNKAKKKAYIEREERKSQTTWIIVLILAIAAGVAVWYFRAEIAAYLINLMKGFLPEQVSAALESVLGGINNG